MTETIANPVLDVEEASGRILIVEDSDTQAMRLRLHLEAAHWTVSRVATGQEARRLLFQGIEGHKSAMEPFDLVMLDYHLPDTSGDILCREIRAQEETRFLPLLMLTGSERQETELETLRSGADDYVSKTVPIEVVLARLDTLLQKARARTELSSRYERERRVAQVLQESLLSAPPEDMFPGLTFCVAYEPAWDEARIGGDFYDIRALGKEWVALIVGDVAGKGLGAATFTAEVKYALRAFLYEHPEPGRALGWLNNFLTESSDQNPWASHACVAVCLALYHRETGEIRVATAGIEPPLLLRRDAAGVVTAAEVTGSRGPMLGVMADMPFETTVISIEPNDILMLCTDGITEARQRRGEMLGYEGMADIARAAYEANHSSTSSIVDAVLAEAKRVSGGQLLDDACLLAVRRE